MTVKLHEHQRASFAFEFGPLVFYLGLSVGREFVTYPTDRAVSFLACENDGRNKGRSD